MTSDLEEDEKSLVDAESRMKMNQNEFEKSFLSTDLSFQEIMLSDSQFLFETAFSFIFQDY
jgi:hypothetical protein